MTTGFVSKGHGPAADRNSQSPDWQGRVELVDFTVYGLGDNGGDDDFDYCTSITAPPSLLIGSQTNLDLAFTPSQATDLICQACLLGQLY